MPRGSNKANLQRLKGGKNPSHAGKLSSVIAGTKKRSFTSDNVETATISAKRQRNHQYEMNSGDPRLSQPGSLHMDAKKRPRPGDDRADGFKQRPQKRLPASEHFSPITGISEDADVQAGAPPTAKTQQSLCGATVELTLPGEVRHLATKYDFTRMHIISSSKMEQKIRNILERISRFTSADAGAKPGVAIVYADAAVANKLISTVELVKREVEKEKGNWHQYSKLDSQSVECKPKDRARASSGRKPKQPATKATGSLFKDSASDSVQQGALDSLEPREAIDVSLEDEAEDAFETMDLPRPTEAVREQSKLRTFPVMTIYIAKVQIPELKDIHG